MQLEDDPLRIRLSAGGGLGHHGHVELAHHESPLTSPGSNKVEPLVFEAGCTSTVVFDIEERAAAYLLTILHAPSEGSVPVPEEGFLIRTTPSDDGWTASVEPAPPRWALQPEFPGNDHTGSRMGPWFWFETRTRQDGTEDHAQGWGNAADVVHVRAGLPAPFSDTPRTVRLVPLSAGLSAPSGDPSDWRDEVRREPTYYEVRVPPNATWRLGIEATWPASGSPPAPAGQACWTLSSTVGEELLLRWQKSDGPCR